MKRRSSRRITASCPSSRCPPRASDRSVAPGIRVAACLANRYGASGSSFGAMRSVGTLSSPNGKAVRPCWRRSRQLTGFPLRFVLAAFNRRSILYRSLIANPGRAFYLDPDCADPQARIGYGYVTNRIGTDLQGDPATSRSRGLSRRSRLPLPQRGTDLAAPLELAARRFRRNATAAVPSTSAALIHGLGLRTSGRF
jgi:hypothetical protein